MAFTQTVVVGQLSVSASSTAYFTTGFCDCFKLSPAECVYGLCCPHCAMASARNKFDTSNWLFNCCCLCSPAMTRSIIRKGYNIQGSGCTDCILGCMCPACVIWQFMGEVNKRGLLMSQRVGGSDRWRVDICNFCDNCNTCCYVACCPSCATASARSEYDGSDVCFNLCACLSPALARNIVREGYGIEGSFLGDLAWSCCCPACVVCQLLNETRARRNPGQSIMIVQNTVAQQPQPVMLSYPQYAAAPAPFSNQPGAPKGLQYYAPAPPAQYASHSMAMGYPGGSVNVTYERAPPYSESYSSDA